MAKWMAVAGMVAAMVLAHAASAADKLVLQLHGPAQFEFAGYYAALWQGFYRDAGLTVEIKPGAGRGQAPIDPIREVTEGRAQFGTGTADLVVRTGQGLPLLLLAPIFQQSGAAVYYRADTAFGSPGALAKAKLGRLPASDILDIELATALQAEGVDAGKIKSVLLEPGQAVAALADRSVDAAIGSAWEVPWTAREKGVALRSFDPGTYRVEYYGDTLFTLQRLAKADSTTVRNFRAASLKGWEYALQHADEIAARLAAELPPPGIGDAAGFDKYQADVARTLARFPDIAIGHSNPERWDRIEAGMVGVGALLRTADTTNFVYDPDAEARSRTDLRAFIIIGATLAVCLIGAGWLGLLHWRRRPTAAAAPAAVPVTTAPPARVEVTDPAAQDLNAAVGRLERVIRQRVPRRISFRLSLLPELWRCRADAATVRRLVLDLAAAAAVDMKGNGEIIIGTRNYSFDEAAILEMPSAKIGDFVRVTVRDNGPGLTEDALDRVLDTVTTSRPAVAAAGEAMRNAGGFARVESAEGVGTAVHIYFPRFSETVAAPHRPKAAE